MSHMKTIFSRKAVKFIVPFNEDITTLQEKGRGFYKAVNKKVARMINDGKIIDIGNRNKVLVQYEWGAEWKTEAQFMNEFLIEEEKPFEGLKLRKHTRTIYQGVVRKYNGKRTRDDKKKEKPLRETTSFIAPRTLNLVWSDNFFKFVDGDVNGNIEFKSLTGKKVQVPYKKTSKKGRIEKNAIKFLPYMKPDETWGATMIFSKDLKRCTIVASAEVPVTFKYEPEGFIGVDINMSEVFDNWLYFSEPIFGLSKIPKSQYVDTIIKTEKALEELNKQTKIQRLIKDRPIRSRERGKLRWKVKWNHRLHEKYIENAVFPGTEMTCVDALCTYAEQNKKGIAIDSVKSGNQNGTFGQDKIPNVLIAECEKRGIPYILTPTPYTSRRCIDCGHVEAEYYANKGIKPNKARDSKTNIFTCRGCGSSHDADFVGATNLAVWAEFLVSVDQWQGDLMKDKWALIKRSFLFKDVKFP